MVRTLLTVALAATGVAACAPYEARPASAREAREFDLALAGRVAGPPQSCLPTRRSSNFLVARNGAMLFGDGSTTYLTQTNGGCDRLSDSGYTLVTKIYGSSSLCSGTIAQVVDLRTGTYAGSCAVGEFIPYRRP